jgi:hypothetical protein
MEYEYRKAIARNERMLFKKTNNIENIPSNPDKIYKEYKNWKNFIS